MGLIPAAGRNKIGSSGQQFAKGIVQLQGIWMTALVPILQN